MRLIASCRQYDNDMWYKLSQLSEKAVVTLNSTVLLVRKMYMVDILDVACEGLRVNKTTIQFIQCTPNYPGYWWEQACTGNWGNTDNSKHILY
jgi:hypothetical protein